MTSNSFPSLGHLHGKNLICVESKAPISKNDWEHINNANHSDLGIISINWVPNKLTHVDVVLSSDLSHLKMSHIDILSINPNAAIIYVCDIEHTECSSEHGFLVYYTKSLQHSNTMYAMMTTEIQQQFNAPAMYDKIITAHPSEDEVFTYGKYDAIIHSRSDGFCAINISLILSPIKIILVGYEYGPLYQSPTHKFKPNTYIGYYQYSQIATITNHNTPIINCSEQIYIQFDNIELPIALGTSQREIPPWVGSWDGETVVITSNGPSLTTEQCDFVNKKQKEGKCKIIAIKNSYSLFDNPDIVFTDGCTEWWRKAKSNLTEHNVWSSVDADRKRKTLPTSQYLVRVEASNSIDAKDIKDIKKMYDLRQEIYGPSSPYSAETLGGLCFIPGIVQRNNTSGFTAINLAYHLGVKKIILLGYDYSVAIGEHWFGSHEYTQTKSQEFMDKFWIPPMEQIRCHIPIVNCSTHTAIKNFRRSTIYEEFSDNPHLECDSGYIGT